MATVNSRTLDEIFCSSQNPTDTLRKLRAQIYPSRTRVEINDKLIKYAFSLTDEGTEDLLEGEIFGIVEKRDYKNLGDIVTAYKILNAAGYTVQRPAREFDRDVLSVCISEQYAGNWCTTPPIIYRGLTGKVGKGSDAKPSKEQLAAIIDSVKFLMSRIIQYDASELCQSMNLNNRQPIRANDQLLPAWFIESSTANGNDATVIFFDRECPLMKLARAKKQILTYESHFLDVPHQQNTFMNIELKNYALRRVQEIIAHKQMRHILTFSDIFSKCRIENASNDTKMNARNTLIAFFEHIKNESLIKDFELTKKRNAFYSIKFSF